MIYVEAPNRPELRNSICIFIAGSIQGSENWQKILIDKIKNLNITILNPRRENFPIHNPDAAYEQIKWEYDMLRKASLISFWFSKETLGPIVLFELGSQVILRKPLIVGCHPDYARKQDVAIQVSLARPGLPVFDNLLDVVMGIRYWYGQLSVHI